VQAIPAGRLPAAEAELVRLSIAKGGRYGSEINAAWRLFLGGRGNRLLNVRE